MQNVIETLPAIDTQFDAHLGNSRLRNATYAAIGGFATAATLALNSDLSNRDILVNAAIGGLAGAAVGALVQDNRIYGTLGAAQMLTIGAGSAVILTRPLIMGLNKGIEYFSTSEVNDEAMPEMELLPEMEEVPTI